jgi:hypothetical protein
MPDQITWRVQHASIVLVSPQPIDPQSVGEEVLKKNRIVPADWQATNAVNTPVLALTQFSNGAVIRVEGTRCIFQQTVNGDFRSQYDVHTVAEDYAEASRITPYRSVGINWMLEPDIAEPSAWLRSKLTKESPLAPGFQPALIRLAKQAGAATCNLSFNLQRGAVLLECNYHIELGSRTAIETMRMWSHYQSALTEDILPTISR